MPSYQLTPLDVEGMTSLYLYGKLTPPTLYNDFIRPADAPSDTTVIDGTAFGLLSNAGPGRFATAALAGFVKTFFGPWEGKMPLSVQSLYATKLAAQGGTGPVSISVDELINQAYIPATAFRFDFEQRGYFGSSDYGARTYIYNSEAFYLSATTIFVFDPNNNDNHITNLQVVPGPDGFGFVSHDSAAVGNVLILKPQVDPYDLGKRVAIQFDNLPTLSGSYGIGDFNRDSQLAATYSLGVLGLGSTLLAMEDIVSQLTSDKIIQYYDSYEGGAPIIYGTNGNDNITIYSLASLPQGALSLLAGPLQIDPNRSFVGVGGAGDDTLTADDVGCFLTGGAGDDTLISGSGSNYLDGGLGTDTAIYRINNKTLQLSTGGTAPSDPGLAPDPADKATFFKIDHGGGVDTLHSIEKIQVSGSGNTLKIAANTNLTDSPVTVDLRATGLDSGDTVDLSQFGGNVYLSSAHPKQNQPNAVELYGNRQFSSDLGVGVTNFNTLILGGGDNKVFLYAADNPYLTTVQTGNGENTIVSDIVNLKINLGTGPNIIGHLGMGTIVNTQGTGGNRIIASDDTLLNGLTPTDEIFSGGHLLRGAVGQIGSEDPWIVGPDGTRYGLNYLGDLVIQDRGGGNTYVSNYHGGPDVPYPEQTAGIFVGLAQVYAIRILDLLRPHIGDMMTLFKLGNEILYTKTGKTFFNSDPLVFDLSGTGVSLTPLSSVAPMLDLRGNGFAMHSGWVGVNQGILVLQQAGHTGTPTISEMFGGAGAEGFAALAQYDTNGDGVIDANDAVYSQLRMWVDRNGNGTVDSGELETLAQAGVTSISLAATAQTADTLAGNTITATDSFTRSDGTSGAIADVSFNVDTFHSTYLGSTSVSAAAAAMPNLKGYGTLTDLRVAMTLDPTLIDTINANLPNLAVPNLAALRAAALPIFLAWAKAVKLPDAGGTLQTIDPAAGHSDVPILLSSDANGNVAVDDLAHQVTDESAAAAAFGCVSRVDMGKLLVFGVQP